MRVPQRSMHRKLGVRGRKEKNWSQESCLADGEEEAREGIKGMASNSGGGGVQKRIVTSASQAISTIRRGISARERLGRRGGKKTRVRATLQAKRRKVVDLI